MSVRGYTGTFPPYVQGMVTECQNEKRKFPLTAKLAMLKEELVGYIRWKDFESIVASRKLFSLVV